MSSKEKLSVNELDRMTPILLVGLLSVWIGVCLPEEPDSTLFSSVAEMSKLAKLELRAVSKLEGLRYLIDLRLTKRDHEWTETGDYRRVHSEVTQLFENLPPSSELEGAGNGKTLHYHMIQPLLLLI